ncbi:heavy metal-binding domain-containing protein [Phaeacidiphilus oryzae]|uniref:heavy metal-binding domain-containing protein n=1 Tax=Phaeacidiphilus oryzae TaxID=348818 RepID=UPI000A06EAF9|nr:heavy metal-binding domain-containing protein [Phaeacidiphilus oryzae]
MAVGPGDDGGGAAWSGSGLPPAAAARTAEAASSGTWSSALSTSAFAAIRSVGFEPVGQVMGSAVYYIGRSGRYWGYHDCLYAGSGFLFANMPAQVAVSGAGAPSAGLVDVVDRARRTALGRMVEECEALGGDGVVSAELTVAPFAARHDCLEFKVIGTAVRARGEVRPRRPFTCHLDGQGFAKLVAGGWIPVELLVGMSVAVRHDDLATRTQTSSWRNVEVGGWTELVQAVRADAREHIHRQAARRGGDGIVLANGNLRTWHEPCFRSGGSEQEDAIAEVTMVGTDIARFRTSAPAPQTLSVLPLGNRGDRLRQRLAAAASSPYADRQRVGELADELRDLGDQG